MKRSILFLLSLAAIGALASGCPSSSTNEIGVVLPLTGAAGDYGQAIKRGMEIAQDQVLAKSSATIVLKIEDSRSDPQHGSEVMQQLVKTSVALIGGVTSAEALEEIKVADKVDKILISPTASSPRLSGISANFYRLFPSAELESITMANFAVDKLKADTVAILATNDAYGNSAAESFSTVFKSKGEVLADVRFEAGGDPKSAVAQALALSPRGVYVAAIGADLASTILALRAAGYNDPREQWILTSSALGLPEVMAAAGNDANRVVFTAPPFDILSTDEPAASFIAAYRAKFQRDPDLYAAHGYDAVLVLARAIEKTGKILVPSDLRKGIMSIQDLVGVGGAIQFRDSGDAQRFPRVFYVSEGKPMDYDKYIARVRAEIQAEIEALRKRREALERRSP